MTLLIIGMRLKLLMALTILAAVVVLLSLVRARKKLILAVVQAEILLAILTAHKNLL